MVPTRLNTITPAAFHDADRPSGVVEAGDHDEGGGRSAQAQAAPGSDSRAEVGPLTPTLAYAFRHLASRLGSPGLAQALDDLFATSFERDTKRCVMESRRWTPMRHWEIAIDNTS